MFLDFMIGCDQKKIIIKNENLNTVLFQHEIPPPQKKGGGTVKVKCDS